jgi:hypothetical protein
VSFDLLVVVVRLAEDSGAVIDVGEFVLTLHRNGDRRRGQHVDLVTLSNAIVEPTESDRPLRDLISGYSERGTNCALELWTACVRHPSVVNGGFCVIEGLFISFGERRSSDPAAVGSNAADETPIDTCSDGLR